MQASSGEIADGNSWNCNANYQPSYYHNHNYVYKAGSIPFKSDYIYGNPCYAGIQATNSAPIRLEHRYHQAQVEQGFEHPDYHGSVNSRRWQAGRSEVLDGQYAPAYCSLQHLGLSSNVSKRTPNYPAGPFNGSPALAEGLERVRLDNNHTDSDQGLEQSASGYLDQDFKKSTQPRNFFRVGKVFRTLWSEAGDSDSVITGGKAWTMNSYGEWIHSKVRYFVVVKESKVFCLALPVTTYNGQGVAKDGVKKSDHTILFTGKRPPRITEAEQPNLIRREQGMQPFPIRVDPDTKGDKLDEMSRLDFAKPATIHHNVKVKSWGMVNRDSLVHLSTQFKQVMNEEQAKADLPSSRILQSRSTDVKTVVSHDTPYMRALKALTKDGWNNQEAQEYLAPMKTAIDWAIERQMNEYGN